ILTALERKQGQEQLERHVAERTRQLAEANAILHTEVRERERSEKIQSILYRIAGLANLDDDSGHFYEQTHMAVGELINAENFYIALLSEDRRELHFPYSVDAVDKARPTRELGRGVSEYVIRSGRPLLADRVTTQRLIDQGELDPALDRGPLARHWLGVPLLLGEQVMGMVAVQSHDESVSYDERDAELLTFVSHQIANSLQRRNA
ncbi:GAF domain-containing protein, partial [Lysobacter sp. A3-1-A15]